MFLWIKRVARWMLLLSERNADTQNLHCVTELILFAFGFLTDIYGDVSQFLISISLFFLFIVSEWKVRAVRRETLKHIFFGGSLCWLEQDSGSVMLQVQRERTSVGTGSTECVVRVLSLTWTHHIETKNKTTFSPSLHSTAPDRRCLYREGKSVSCGYDLMYVRDSGPKCKTMCLELKKGRFFSLEGAALLSLGHVFLLNTFAAWFSIREYLFIAIIPIALCGCTWKI